MGVVLRLGRPLPPGVYHVFIAFFTRFFTPITASVFFTRFFFLTRFFLNAFFSFLGGRCRGFAFVLPGTTRPPATLGAAPLLKPVFFGGANSEMRRTCTNKVPLGVWLKPTRPSYTRV